METETLEEVQQRVLVCNVSALNAVRDALQALNGSWKLQIMFSLMNGDKRFRQIAKEVTGISDKMLSKELKDLELNKLVTRTVHDTFPPMVEYSVTPHARTLDKVMASLRDWGVLHRMTIIGR